MLENISVSDIPVAGTSDDSLETNGYAKALAQFIRGCQSPLTIGIQGEWGSGKTSLLNLIREDLETQKYKRGRGSPIDGKDAYKIIWVNTWEFALLKSPEETLLAIIEEIISVISKVDGSWNAATKAKNSLARLARGALRAGATAALSTAVGVSKGSQIAEEILGGDSPNSVRDLRNSLAEIITNIVVGRDGQKANTVERFVIFIDDLDRLDPVVAVQILELLKNIFDLQHTVFVLAIDYKVVVKGLKFKFGEPTEENEWEFRAFFDKIIQLPFMMPISGYNLDKYITDMMGDKIGFFKSSNEQSVIRNGLLTRIVKNTVGPNPRALKRLTNSISLINIFNEEKISEIPTQSLLLKQIVFALICMQISFPKIYEILLINPDFKEWDDDFCSKVTGGVHHEDVKLKDALAKIKTAYDEDFNEGWEEVLFEIVWLKGWQKSRLVEASRLLSIIKDEILSTVTGSAFTELMTKALEMTSVTAVIANFENASPSAADDDLKSKHAKAKIDYWNKFAFLMEGSGTGFEDSKPNIIVNYLYRTHDEILKDQLRFVVSIYLNQPLKLETYSGNAAINFKRFQYFKKFRQELERTTGSNIRFEGDEGTNKQVIVFMPPDELKSKLKVLDPGFMEKAEPVMQWIRSILPKVEAILTRAVKEEDDFQRLNFLAQNAQTEHNLSTVIDDGEVGDPPVV